MFSAISYISSRTYKYTIKEVQGSLADVTYDTTEFEVTVLVTNIGSSIFQVVATYPTGGAIFENIYDTPTTLGSGGEEPIAPETSEEEPTITEEPDVAIIAPAIEEPTVGSISTDSAPQTGTANDMLKFLVLALIAIAWLVVVTRRRKMN